MKTLGNSNLKPGDQVEIPGAILEIAKGVERRAPSKIRTIARIEALPQDMSKAGAYTNTAGQAVGGKNVMIYFVEGGSRRVSNIPLWDYLMKYPKPETFQPRRVLPPGGAQRAPEPTVVKAVTPPPKPMVSATIRLPDPAVVTTAGAPAAFTLDPELEANLARAQLELGMSDAQFAAALEEIAAYIIAGGSL